MAEHKQPGVADEELSVKNAEYLTVVPKTASSSLQPEDVTEDVAAHLAQRFKIGDSYTRREAMRLRWKIDFRLIPLLFLNVVLPAMDKVSHSTGALYGLRGDLHLVGEQYSWVGSIFYV